MSIYVQTTIRGSLDEVWRRTHDPKQHQRWDLRFTDIEYLPRPDLTKPQRFLYQTRIGFGLAIAGEGESVGSQVDELDQRTSALKFWSNDPKSLIREGAGFWQYVPTHDGVRFLTAYDYRVRFGIAGRVIDAVVFRPLITWATAWSFDRLRLWIENGTEPAASLRLAMIHWLARLGVAFVWIYQGFAPKLLRQHADELAMIADAGLTGNHAGYALWLVGGCEVVFGLSLLFVRQAGRHFAATIVAMVLATLMVAIVSPRYLTAAFNPVSLNVLLAAMATIGLLAGSESKHPSARRCRLLRARSEK
ncbi:MAG TPA: DoxX-like family protein [Pirellulales bacterium]|nr:DoxX-like family protein [Pirellulales bacterium]